MLPRALFALALVSSTATACARVSIVRLSTTAPAIPVDSVRVFATHSPEEYQEVALLRLRRNFAGDTRALKALRERAARIGANGVLLLNTRGNGGVNGTGTGVVIGGRRRGDVIVGSVDTDVDEFERAVAIRYKPR